MWVAQAHPIPIPASPAVVSVLDTQNSQIKTNHHAYSGKYISSYALGMRPQQQD